MKKRFGLVILAGLLASGTGFTQNTLDYYLRAARENNPVIKENLSQKDKAVIQEKIIRAEYQGPKIYASGEVNYPPLFPNKDDPRAFGYERAITNGGLIAANLNGLQPVFNRQVRETLTNQVRNTGEAGVVQASLTLHQLEKEVTDQFIIACQNLSQINFTTDIKNQLLKQKELVETLAQSGIYKASDILLIKIEIENETALLNNLQSVYHQNLSLLNSKCGLTNEPPVNLILPDIKPKDADQSSKFLEKFRSDSLREVYNLESANLKYKPQFSVYGNTGLKAMEFQGIQRKFGIMGGLTMFIPIYDGHQKEFISQQTEINIQNIANYKQDFLIQKSNRQKALYSSLVLIVERIDILQAQLNDYQKLIELYQSELKAGNLEMINYMNTIRAYSTLQNELTVNEINKLLLINESNYYNW